MDVAAGAMTPLIKKLGSLLVDEYNLEKRVRKGIKSLITELELMHTVLRKIGAKPQEQFDDQVLIWAGKVRDLSYHMEDAVDTFTVRMSEDDHDHGSTNMKNKVKKFMRKTSKLFTKGKALHQISDAIEEAQELAKELGELRQRYMLEVHANTSVDAIDPRLKAVYKDVMELVGIDHVLYELDKSKYSTINEATRDDGQLLDELRMFLQDKRYLIVIDDIWNEEAWEFIKCAFSDNCLGSRVMTTTRIGSISKACCSSRDDIIYQMKPLTDDDSERLFYKRIFPQGSKPVSKAILKKCGGLPLAIITIASILANNGEDEQVKLKYQWDTILGSIGRGLAEGASVKDMQRILSFSYYDLPSHLKTCLLYLSIFPEDFEISRKQETRLFELGETYFNELANRNLIQPVGFTVGGRATACRLHDMVLDLLCSLSSEENFLTILDGTQQSKPISHCKIRRLSFQNSMSELTTHRFDATSMSQVRYIENLLHLRYLGLRGTSVGELPVEIGKLQFLETLDLVESGSKPASSIVIPSSVVRLRHLMCLKVSYAVLPVGIGNLKSLEELTGVIMDGSSETEKELGKLIELRVLSLICEGNDDSVFNSLAVSLGKLGKLQSLCIYGYGNARFDDSWDGWV
ncbi:hypothetical protein ZWY2020_029097 [Hordeum vulgare]|nr:hypothetical protein ZWY2020_029097 [Hordeum vulgare]